MVLRSPADDQQADNNLVVNFNYMQQKYNLAPPPTPADRRPLESPLMSLLKRLEHGATHGARRIPPRRRATRCAAARRSRTPSRVSRDPDAVPGDRSPAQPQRARQAQTDLGARPVDSIRTMVDEVRHRLKNLFDQIIESENLVLTRAEKERLFEELAADVIGFGPIEPLLNDPTVSEIMVNGPKKIYFERKGRLLLSDVQFDDDDHVRRVIDRIVSPLGRHVDEASPIVDARLPDGSRVNVVIPPISLIGPMHHHPKVHQREAARRRPDPLRLDDARDRRVPARLRRRAPEHRHLRRHGLGQDHAAQRAAATSSPTTSASSASKTRPSCSWPRITGSVWRRARPTSKAPAPSPPATA